jgi:hypothetical protein
MTPILSLTLTRGVTVILNRIPLLLRGGGAVSARRAGTLMTLCTAALLIPFGSAAAQERLFDRIGLQIGLDHWNTIAGAANPGGGPGVGLRYENDAFAPIDFHSIRAYVGLDVFLAKNTNTGGRTVLEDITLGMNAVLPLRSGLTPYAGGGLGFVFGGGAAGASPIVSVGLQMTRRNGKIPYADLTFYTRNSRRMVVTVGMFL